MYLFKFKKDKTKLSTVYTIDHYSQPDFISHKDIQKISTHFHNNIVTLEDDG